MLSSIITINLLVSQSLFARAYGGTGNDHANSIIQTSDGGFAVAGWIESFGAGATDFLVLKLASDGNYTDCVYACSPTVVNVSPSTTSPSPTVRTPSLTITNACAPVDLEEKDISSFMGITCSPIPNGILFLSPEDMPVKICSADGRLAYSGNLGKGKNRISLEQGVYIWMAGIYREKAAIR